MADNPTVTLRSIAALEQTTGAVAADDVGGVLYQYVKLAFGSDGSVTLVSAANPLPTTGPSGNAMANAAAVVVVGAGSTLIMAENAARKGLILYFEGDTYVNFGASATSSAMLFYAGSYLNMLSGYVFTGDITGARVGSVDVNVRKVEF